MRPVGPTWGFLVIGAILAAAGIFCVVRPELAWRMRKVADEDLRTQPASRRTLIFLRLLGGMLAVGGTYAFIAALVR
jgi:hypothetical protein